MDYKAALQDDVVPDDGNQLVQWATRYDASLETEALHLFISDPKTQRPFWIRQLPRMRQLRYLQVKSRPNQELFEAICAVPNLERLNIYWSNIVDLSPIASLGRLTHLMLGSSPKLKTLEPLAKLDSLRALGIRSVKDCPDLSPIGALTHLRGLELCGADYTVQVFRSLDPLRPLQDLSYLSLAQLRTMDGSLGAVAGFRRLKYLRVAPLKNWAASEYRFVHAALPDLACEEVHLAATDASFRKAHGIE